MDRRAKKSDLSQIYDKWFADSPRAIEMEFPCDVGNGTVVQSVMKSGMVISDWSMRYDSDMYVDGVNSGTFVQLLFCFKQGVSWEREGMEKGISMEQGDSCLYYGNGKREFIHYQKGAEYQFKNIRIPVSYFQKVLEDCFPFDQSVKYQKHLSEKLQITEITPYMTQVLMDMAKAEQYRDGIRHLFMEGKVRELMAIYLAALFEMDLRAEQPGLTKVDCDSLKEVKKMIDNDVACVPVIARIAKQVGMSESKLTKGFAAMFGMPIHAYVIEKRLEISSVLLLDGRWNVQQIAEKVGYGKAGNFSAAFKKKYGITPKLFRKARENSLK